MKGIFCAIAILVAVVATARHLEAKDFNGGTCRRCGKRLRRFDTDSQGGRGYTCDGCGYTVWVSYKVDKQYTE